MFPVVCVSSVYLMLMSRAFLTLCVCVCVCVCVYVCSDTESSNAESASRDAAESEVDDKEDTPASIQDGAFPADDAGP